MNENIGNTEEFERDWTHIGERLTLYSSSNKKRASIDHHDPAFDEQRRLDTSSNNLDVLYLIEVGVKKPSERVILKKLMADMQQQRYASAEQR